MEEPWGRKRADFLRDANIPMKGCVKEDGWRRYLQNLESHLKPNYRRENKLAEAMHTYNQLYYLSNEVINVKKLSH
jgi:hypothetical protein